MGTLWLKIKIWTKTIVVFTASIYAALFILNNSDKRIDIWYWFQRIYSTSMLMLILGTWQPRVAGPLLARATSTTLRQTSELREASRIARREREQADMKAKAATLQTPTASVAPVVTAPTPTPTSAPAPPAASTIEPE